MNYLCGCRLFFINKRLPCFANINNLQFSRKTKKLKVNYRGQFYKKKIIDNVFFFFTTDVL